MEQYFLQFVIGVPLETTIFVERMICSGILDRHPGLRIILAHGGGFYPYQAGRLRHARSVRNELADTPSDPWLYAGHQLFADTITHDRAALQYLISRLGSQSIVMGTDFPYDMASPEPMQALLEAVDKKTAKAISEENPASLFHFS
jgi:aminocarboxymuconate-semialdehyde decarboxylase